MNRHFLMIFSFLISLLSTAPAVASMDNLLTSEKNNVEIFRRFSPKVVFINRMGREIHHAMPQKKVIGAGSGILWDNRGHIVTNFHVVKGASDLTVTMGSYTFPARVVGTEPRKDLAVLSISSPKALAMLQNYKPFILVHSSDLLVGQKVLAIGNPFGLDHTLTIGVISALGRNVPGVGGVTIHEMIQTDASINPGNSGGPLLDSHGRLIGLNTAIYSNTGSSTGIGFAIPANDLERIVPQIIHNGRPELAGIGIRQAELKFASQNGIKKGILIARVLPDSPAAHAGLRGTVRDSRGHEIRGDVIVSVNGKTIENYDDLYNLFNKIKVGQTITVTVEREGKMIPHKMKTIDIAGY